MYKPKHFSLQEWLPKEYYAKMFPAYGERLWRLFDERILITFDGIRELHGPIIMNTWFSDSMKSKYGNHQWRGYRDHTSPYVQRDSTSPFGNLSDHRTGKAGDGVPLLISAEDVRKDILANPTKEEYKHITCIEADTAWLHLAVRNRRKELGIQIVHP